MNELLAAKLYKVALEALKVQDDREIWTFMDVYQDAARMARTGATGYLVPAAKVSESVREALRTHGFRVGTNEIPLDEVCILVEWGEE